MNPTSFTSSYLRKLTVPTYNLRSRQHDRQLTRKSTHSLSMTHYFSLECCTKTHTDDLLLYSFIFLSLHFCFPCISLRFFNFLYTNIWIYGYGPWNSDERAAVHRQMNTHLLLGQVPRKAECVKCIKNEPCLSQRDWKTVKYFVHTTIQRNKRLQNII